uniref:RRM domain-containing protein n=1 Tax=Strigamia maritima TaxID=126957 RepID=T1JE91_STRMM
MADKIDPKDTSVTDLVTLELRAKEMEEEVAKLKDLQIQIERSLSPIEFGADDKAELDSRSIYVGNVDYEATAEELKQHFIGCGAVNRVTILANKFTGHPKGFAYIEFADVDSVTVALTMNETIFRARQIKVNAKRTNRPGIYSATNRPSRGRGSFRRPTRGRGYGAPSFSDRGGFGPSRRARTKYGRRATPY